MSAWTWPEEHGGAELGPVEQVIVSAELRRAGCGGILENITVGIIGPTIIARGTDEQRQRHLGPMLRGEEIWCQLFSEPAAGSDRAGIHSPARRTDTGSRSTWCMGSRPSGPVCSASNAVTGWPIATLGEAAHVALCTLDLEYQLSGKASAMTAMACSLRKSAR